MEIKSSLDWQNVEVDLKSQLKLVKDLRHQMQARKMLDNFEPMIIKLSKLELTSRTTQAHPTRYIDEQLELINTEINNFEQWLMLLVLLS